MGILTYGPFEVLFDDRTLAHLRLVMTAKLRRGESFVLCWSGASGTGNGQDSVWISPYVPLHFHLDDSRHTINKAWLEILMQRANSVGGLVVAPEPDPAG